MLTRNKSIALAALASGLLVAGLWNPSVAKESDKVATDEKKAEQLEKATFGSGCFWCTEAIFQRLEGVEKVRSGYTGGHVKNPTYKQVTTGLTGHAEACEILYDPEKISYPELLKIFWETHDPTTLNRQGNDVGPQYRSAIFYHNEEQREVAEKYKQQLNQQRAFGAPVVTEITEASTFYVAEDYHQNYFNDNRRQSYCRFVITPKVKKFEGKFRDKLKKDDGDEDE